MPQLPAGDGLAPPHADPSLRRLYPLLILGSLSLGLVFAFRGGLGGSSTGAQGDTSGGVWSSPITWPTTGIHASVVPDGRVLTYAYPFQQPFASTGYLWDPASPGAFQPAPATYNLFCGGHTFLADGRLLNLGGTTHDSPVEGNPWGHRQVRLFDYQTSAFTQIGETNLGRWYPTLTTLPDGRVLISSGFDGAGQLNNQLEIWDTINGAQLMPASTNAFLPLYPWMHVLPNGKLFDSGPQDISIQLDFTTNAWSGVAYNQYGNRSDGTSLLLPLEAPTYNPEVMIIGGDNPATSTTERIDLGAPVPAYQYADDMAHARHHANAVLLPDGTVGIFGGTALLNEPAQAVYTPEIYDPDSNTWTEMAQHQRARIYHSTALLLPDGRVLHSGTDGDFTAEVYSPPYLFRGARPAISDNPGAVAYGANFLVTTPDSTDISKVMLMRPGAVTHSVNMEQRAVQLSYEIDAGALRVDAPPNGNIAPPGYYMLFIVDTEGVPSTAGWVRIGATGDSDGDGLSDQSEADQYGTDPMAADSDSDSLSDGDEVLVQSTNPLDPDFENDGLEDGQEILLFFTDPFVADTDGDLIVDGPEVVCGSVPADPASRPERLDGAFAGADDDGDSSVDEPLPQGADGSDCDGDGYTGTLEQTIYAAGPASDQDPCGGSTLPAGPRGWPSDFMLGGIPDSTNRINVTDLTSFLGPVRRLNTSPGPGSNYHARWDLVPGPGLFQNWIVVNDLTALLNGPSGFPPMLGGARAFNGPPCPWPP